MFSSSQQHGSEILQQVAYTPSSHIQEEALFTMGEAQEVQLHVREAGSGSGSPKTATFSQTPPSSSKLKSWRWWLMISLLTLFILVGQTAATLLGRFYYKYGGKSIWMATIVQSAGAPLLLPFILLYPIISSSSSTPATTTAVKISAVYIGIGLLIAGDNLMYSYGLLYLPVSTYSLLCATQLAFNALFAYFLNSQKFTPFIFNSILLLTLSAALLGVRSEGSSVSSNKYPLGFALTIGASATFSLIMSLMQFSFQKVLKSETFLVVIQMILWTNFLASTASVAGLFVSGEWKGIHSEFVEFEKGEVSYIMALVWIAISWLLFSVGTVGLIFVVSSLFSNVIATLALPLVPMFAVVFFHDKMDGVKVVALLIAILGFANYLYQHYLDDSKEKSRRKDDDL
ncbi:probable purine permease 11 [Phalaenopsis equestris]|uniref:probable purine permease 11 n=1 Tax=Phalaenopsis equestris TaxID=78828 RepID=UPI0009E47498|nr:probable purine permease 11 [Phalaenopsis equestris]